MCLLEARAERSSCNNPCIIIYSQMVTQFYLFLCGDTLHIKILKSFSEHSVHLISMIGALGVFFKEYFM